MQQGFHSAKRLRKGEHAPEAMGSWAQVTKQLFMLGRCLVFLRVKWVDESGDQIVSARLVVRTA